MSEEIWKPITESNGVYEVSNLGRVRNVKKGLVLKTGRTHGGYRRVCIYGAGGYKKTKMRHVAALVLTAFVGPRPPGYQAAHLDGKPDNNALTNLAWCTPAENEAHKVLHGTRTWGERHGLAKFTNDEAAVIRFMVKHGARPTILARICGVDRGTIERMAEGKSWGVALEGRAG